MSDAERVARDLIALAEDVQVSGRPWADQALYIYHWMHRGPENVAYLANYVLQANEHIRALESRLKHLSNTPVVVQRELSTPSGGYDLVGPEVPLPRTVVRKSEIARRSDNLWEELKKHTPSK